jgi:hypothetical protein
MSNALTAHVVSILVVLAHDVKEKGVDVIVKRLVVQKEFGEVAQVLAIYFFEAAFHFKHGYPVMPGRKKERKRLKKHSSPPLNPPPPLHRQIRWSTR